MRITSILLFITSLLSAQITDNFSDGNFTISPTWSGDTSVFIINASAQLQVKNTVSDTSYLTTKRATVSLINTQWNFFIKQTFAPSANNYGRVYLATDQPNFKSPLNGYYLQFGEAGNADAVELFRQTNLTRVSVARGVSGKIARAFAICVKVTCDTNGSWNVYIDEKGGTAYVLEAQGKDTVHKTASYFGVLAAYTASNATKFYFDDFYNGAILVDTVPPAVVSVTAYSKTKISILFTEEVDSLSSQIHNNYFVNNGIGNPSGVHRDSINLRLVHLTFATSFQKKIIYAITVNHTITDCVGNFLSTNKALNFAIPDSALANDIVINEILFNPKNGGVDFIELYNRSNKIIDLNTLCVSNYDTISGSVLSVEKISTNTFLLFPEEYIVLSENDGVVKKNYHTINPNAFINMHRLPAMNIDAGIVCLSNGKTIIDKLNYSDKMHVGLLNDTKGISLERVNFNRPTQDQTNWHSSAKSVGYATPGYKNSQFNSINDSENEVQISPELFSPDEDGYNDIVNIRYHFDTPAFIATISIYDSKGRLIKFLVRNELLATEGTFSWDGTNENREKERLGIYIIYFEALDLSGTTKQYKKTCVLAGKI